MGQRRTERGNALLITLMVVTLIGAIGLSSARLALSSLQRQGRMEDSASAYQAALAGIEDGLLRWRHNRDVEVPAVGSICLNPPTSGSQEIDRIYLVGGSEVQKCIDQKTTPALDTPTYDLKIWYRHAKGEVEEVESPTYSSGISRPALEKDETVEYIIDPNQWSQLKVKVDPNSSVYPNQVLDFITRNTSGEEGFVPMTLGTPNQFTSVALPINTQRFQMQYFGSNLKSYTLDPGHEGQISSRYTTIESTGYYGGVKRKLVVKLDRFGNKLYSPFSFVLFAGEGDITTSP